MSADNAVYIRPMPNGKFAVKEINSFYPEELTTDEEIDKEFAGAPQYNTEEEAWQADEVIQEQAEKDQRVIEYASQVIPRKSHSQDE